MTHNYNKIKIYSITLFIITKYEVDIFTTLYKDYIMDILTKPQYIIVLIMCKSYHKKNIYRDDKIYKFINLYIDKCGSELFKKLLFV